MIFMNNHFKKTFCMYDKGYITKDKKTPFESCKNFTNPKLPICIARGAYN